MKPDVSFLPTYPLRIVVWADEDATKSGRVWNRMEGVQVNGNLCLAVFTDEDLADRFCASKGVPANRQYIVVASPQELVRWLVQAKSYGFVGVCVDCTGTGKKGLWATIETLLKVHS